MERKEKEKPRGKKRSGGGEVRYGWEGREGEKRVQERRVQERREHDRRREEEKEGRGGEGRREEEKRGGHLLILNFSISKNVKHKSTVFTNYVISLRTNGLEQAVSENVFQFERIWFHDNFL